MPIYFVPLLPLPAAAPAAAPAPEAAAAAFEFRIEKVCFNFETGFFSCEDLEVSNFFLSNFKLGATEDSQACRWWANQTAAF